MTDEQIVYLATGACIAVVVLVWSGLVVVKGPRGINRVLHRWFGLLGAIIWVTFLVASPDDFWGSAEVGIVGLGLWWFTAAIGILLMYRLLPSKGRRVHAQAQQASGAWRGGVAVGAHILMIAGVAVVSWGYINSFV